MFKLLMYFIFILAISAIPVLADFEGSYVIIEYFNVNNDGTESVFGTSEWDCGSGDYMYNTFFKSLENGIGITGGTYAEYDDVCFEMTLYFKLIKYQNRIMLKGIIKAYNIDNNDIIDGKRKVIYQDIEYNKLIKFKYKLSGKENSVGVNLTLVDKKPRPVVADGPISLRTKFLNVHDVFGYQTSSRGKIESKTNFQTSTGKTRDDGNMEKALILTEVLLPGFPKNLRQPFQTELLFKRLYKIDTLFVSDQEFTEDITYESKYKKQVELVPGKTLLLVFPADTPSVRGFDREDTLIIKP